jgi:hypothetical protein
VEASAFGRPAFPLPRSLMAPNNDIPHLSITPPSQISGQVQAEGSLERNVRTFGLWVAVPGAMMSSFWLTVELTSTSLLCRCLPRLLSLPRPSAMSFILRPVTRASCSARSLARASVIAIPRRSLHV